MKKFIAILAFIPTFAFGATLNLLPGDTMQETVVATCATCPPPPPPITIVVSPPGNAHAAMHPSEAKLKGFAYCQECHSLTGKTPAKSAGKFICSQAKFCGQPTNTPGGKTCTVGVPALDPTTGAPLVDKVSGKAIVGGGYIGMYAVGQTPQCADCHNMARNAGQAEWKSSQIHEGCLTCHVRVGSGDVKSGVQK